MLEGKRVLFVSPSTSSFTHPVTKALKRLGASVVNFFDDKPNWSTRVLGFLTNSKILNSSLGNKLGRLQLNRAFYDAVQKTKPNFVLVIKGKNLEAKCIRQISQLGIVTINWFPDCQDVWQWLVSNAPAYSHFFTCCLDLEYKLKKNIRHCAYLPYASDPDKVLHKVQKKFNIVFVGQYTKKRERYFSTLVDLKLDIWGYKGWSRSNLSENYHGYVISKDMKTIFRQSKIVLNMTTSEEERGFQAANLRNFEVTGVGSFLLTQTNRALEKLFVVGKEIVCFDDEEDLRKKVVYYLQNDSEREAIARAGWQRVSRDHTYEERLTTLFNQIQK